ncbi:WYL domain-containing protein [Leadbettera azotonutricia]|uniref:WYL domain-containing protein n=1 Tax=Leadbettera azotonutricia TaxID=150829 RepID=UPI000313223C|nr:WYL domain-containing protein [Leadbettera azotonutricia]
MEYLTGASSDCGEDYYYNQKIGRYLKAVFEEYIELPYYKRERIFFFNEIREAKEAIQSGKRLKITPGNSDKSVTYYLKPYRVMTDPQSTYYYLTGYSSKADSTDEYIPASFRISRIKEIKIMRGKSGKITRDQKLELENLLLKKGAPFLLGDVKSIKVMLTELGKKYYRQQLHLRPLYDEIIDGNIYVFNCSREQIKNYFIKFGKEALVIEPPDLKKYFRDFFLDSCNAYS